MRQTLTEASKQFLTSPVGSEHTIAIDINDGLTGQSTSMGPRGSRPKQIAVKVEQQTRADGKKRLVVKAVMKGTMLASAPWG